MTPEYQHFFVVFSFVYFVLFVPSW